QFRDREVADLSARAPTGLDRLDRRVALGRVVDHQQQSVASRAANEQVEVAACRRATDQLFGDMKEHVASGSAIGDVVAEPIEQEVPASSADQHVVAVLTGEDVRARAAILSVVPATA